MQPTGRLTAKEDGVYVVFDRLLHAPTNDVWRNLTHTAELARWIGELTGQASTGSMRFRMSIDEDGPWQNVTLLECEPPHRFIADVGCGEQSWRVSCHLTEAGGHTALTVARRLRSPSEAHVAARWDYYLARLTAFRDNRPTPVRSDYTAALIPAYRFLSSQMAAGRPAGLRHTQRGTFDSLRL